MYRKRFSVGVFEYAIVLVIISIIVIVMNMFIGQSAINVNNRDATSNGVITIMKQCVEQNTNALLRIPNANTDEIINCLYRNDVQLYYKGQLIK